MRNKAKIFSDSAGFTLVELIVVIAILGILAGVGTVGYSGYVQKANQAADETMIASIENALLMGAYANTYAPDSGLIGAVGVSKDTDADATTADIEGMMVTAFGENWKTTLRLKSDAYTDSDTSKILTLIKEDSTEYFDSISGSSFYNTENSSVRLASDVDSIASAFTAVLEGTGSAFSMLWGKDYQATVSESGLDYRTDGNESMAANLTVFAAANEIANGTGSQQDWIETWVDGGDYTISMSTQGYVAPMVLKLARYEAIVKSINDDDLNKTFNDEISKIDEYVDKYNGEDGNKYLNAYNEALGNIASSIEYYEDYEGYSYTDEQAEKDAKAFIATMKTVHALEDSYVTQGNADTLNQANMFTNSNAAALLDTMVAYSVQDSLPDDGYCLITLMISDGTPTIIR